MSLEDKALLSLDLTVGYDSKLVPQGLSCV